MKTLLLAVAGAALFVASAPQAAPSESDRYAARANARAQSLLESKNIDTRGEGVSVRATVDPMGSITAIKVVRSSGSAETDRAVEAVLRRVVRADAPAGLMNGAVTLNVGKTAILQASAH
jgi:TonB family protein